MSPSGQLPFIRDGLQVVGGCSAIDIFEWLRKKDDGFGFDLDADLTPRERAEAVAFITLIEEKMHDALLYNWWLDTDNFIKNTRPVFSKALPLVLRYVLPSQLVQKAQARLAGYKMVEVDDEQKGGALKQKIPQVYLQARNIYAQLARKLGTKEYFFGEKPSSLDAVAFAHLSVHAYPSLANPKLFSMLAFEFPTLIAYCDRIAASTYFQTPIQISPTNRKSIRTSLGNFLSAPGVTLEKWWMGSSKNPKNKSREERVEDFYRILSAVAAVGFFIGYIVVNKIIQIDTSGIDDEEEGGHGEEEWIDVE